MESTEFKKTMVLASRFGRLLLRIAAVLMGLILLAFFLLPVYGQHNAERAAFRLYSRPESGKTRLAFVDQGLATSDVIGQMEALDTKYGAVTHFEVVRIYVQLLGDPWGVSLRVTRGGKDYREILGGSLGCAHSLYSEPWKDVGQ